VARFVALAMKVAIVFFYFDIFQNKKTTYYKENFYNMLHYRVSKGCSLGTLSLLAMPIS